MGVSHGLGPTCVWCELLLDQTPVLASDHASGKRTYA